MNDYEEFIKSIIDNCKKYNITSEKISKYTSINESTASDILSGKCQNINDEELDEINELIIDHRLGSNLDGKVIDLEPSNNNEVSYEVKYAELVKEHTELIIKHTKLLQDFENLKPKMDVVK